MVIDNYGALIPKYAAMTELKKGVPENPSGRDIENIRKVLQKLKAIDDHFIVGCDTCHKELKDSIRILENYVN